MVGLSNILNAKALTGDSPRIDSYFYRPAGLDARKAECPVGIHAFHRRLGMGQ